MKRALIIVLMFSVFLLPTAWATEDDTPLFKVARLVLSRTIEDREPVGITSVFTQSDKQAYCFLEALDITENTQVAFVWYYKDQETARIELPIRKGSRWRTYSSKKFGVRTGMWRIDLVDAHGTVLQSIPFEVR